MLNDVVQDLQQEYERTRAIRLAIEKEIKRSPWITLMRALFWFYIPVLAGTLLAGYLIYIFILK